MIQEESLLFTEQLESKPEQNPWEQLTFSPLKKKKTKMAQGGAGVT